MKSQKIWHVSEGRRFPLDFRKQDSISFELVEIAPSALSTVQPEPEFLHVFLIQGERGGLAAMRNLIESTPHLRDFPRILILSQTDYQDYRPDRHSMNLLVLDDSVRPGHLKLILELVLRIEYYRQVVFRLSEDVREQSRLFDKMLNLTRTELKTAQESSKAYEALLEFERSQKRFEHSVMEAMEKTMHLKDHEMLELKTTLAAYERLSQFRDQELYQMKEQVSATETALEFSRKEGIEREKVILAMERLRNYTDKELIDLFNENQRLREQLGLPPKAFGTP